MASEGATQEAFVKDHGVRHAKIGKRLQTDEAVARVGFVETMNQGRGESGARVRPEHH